MADKKGSFLARIIVALALGIFGYIIGTLLTSTAIFPESLLLAEIFLFLGFTTGLFLDKIEAYLGDLL